MIRGTMRFIPLVAFALGLSLQATGAELDPVDVKAIEKFLEKSATVTELGPWTIEIATVPTDLAEPADFGPLRGVSFITLRYNSIPVATAQAGGQWNQKRVDASGPGGETVVSVFAGAKPAEHGPLSYWSLDENGKRLFKFVDFEMDGQLDMKLAADGSDQAWVWFEGSWLRLIKEGGLYVEVNGEKIPISRQGAQWVTKLQ
jgi:hypothetical protein